MTPLKRISPFPNLSPDLIRLLILFFHFQAQEWNSAAHAIECQLELEQTVHKALIELHKVADGHGDAQLCDFIESEYLAEQVTAEKEVGDLLTKMKRTGSEGLGLHIIDKELQG